VPGVSNPQALNRYSYVLNNPIRYTDPTGHYCVEDDVNGVPVRADCWTGVYSTTTSSTSTTTTTTTTQSGGGGGSGTSTVTTTPTPTSTVTPTSCTGPYIICVSTATVTPTATPPYIGPTIGPANPSSTWEFPYAIGVTDRLDLGIDIAGIVGDGASLLGVPGKIIWGLTEGAEMVGVGKDVYDLAINRDSTGITSTLLFDSAEKLIPDIIRMKNPGLISLAGNLWSISQNITLTPK
jgi:hypothetical protein